MRWLVILALVSCSKSKEPPPPAPAVSPTPADAAAPNLQTQVFATPSSELPLTISIETLGGVATPVLTRGTALPAHFSDVFSTSADNQSSVEVHITAGERPLAKDNVSLGKFQVTGIPPAPRATPRIDVELAIDAEGVLTVTATDQATGNSRTMTISGKASAPIDRAGIDRAIADKDANHAADVAASTRLHAHLDLDQLRSTTRQTLDAAGDKLPAALRAKITKALASADRVNADWDAGDPNAIIAETEKLRAIATEMDDKLDAP